MEEGTHTQHDHIEQALNKEYKNHKLLSISWYSNASDRVAELMKWYGRILYFLEVMRVRKHLMEYG
jgi:hypothetical protein